jgi:hypothetical protein
LSTDPAAKVPGRGTRRLPSGSDDGDFAQVWQKDGAVDGDIRIGTGRCLRVFAYFGLLFAIPATAVLAVTGLQPPVSVVWVLLWCTGQAILGGLLHRSGMRARRRVRATTLNVAVERAIRLG